MMIFWMSGRSVSSSSSFANTRQISQSSQKKQLLKPHTGSIGSLIRLTARRTSSTESSLRHRSRPGPRPDSPDKPCLHSHARGTVYRDQEPGDVSQQQTHSRFYDKHTE